jgi:outer membrane protein TolC
MILVGTAVVLVLTAASAGQDTVDLPGLQEAAAREDPRAGQLVLQARAHELRLRNLRTEHLPQLQFQGEGTRQSEVPTLPLRLPDLDLPEPPRTRFQAALGADQLLYDGGVLRRREAAERARHAEVEAELRARLYPLRMEVNEAFFRALLLKVREAELRLLLTDLDARLAQVRSQVRAGTALPGDTAAIQAERLRAGQALGEMAADHAAVLAVLSELTGRSVAEHDVLVLPDLADEVARVEASGGPGSIRDRPEFARFALSMERLAREAEVVRLRTRPQLRAFGQAGLGRPGPFQIFEDDLNEYWRVGVGLQWNPWPWGNNARERELLRVERQVLQTEAAALAARLEREVQADIHAMRRLERSLATDEQIVALREQVERQARRQFEERSLTASQYLSARTDVFEARLSWQRHRIEIEHARARYLTTLGVMPGSRHGSHVPDAEDDVDE